MPVTVEQEIDLKRAYEALKGKQKEYELYWRYYDGDQPLVYSTDRLKEVFKEFHVQFQANWCATVIDAALERINLTSFTVADNEQATDVLNQAWIRTEMNLDSDDAHTAALVIGEAYVIAWRNEGEELEVFYNDPRLCHIFYEAENPRQKQFAAKWWIDDDEKYRLTLYYPDRVEYYGTEKKARNVNNHKSFLPLGDITGNEADSMADNPFSRVPIFHLRRERRKVKSELANAIPLQDAVNKLLADMMVAAEFGAFKQRYIISSMDSAATVLKNAPYLNWDLPAAGEGEQPTTVGEFSATDLQNFLRAIDQLSLSIGIITRTPKQYFFQASTSNVSGEALVALEAPLVKKCERYIERFSATWQKVAAFMLELLGVTVDPIDIMPMFDRPETVQPLTKAMTRKTNVDAGMPLKFVLSQEGASQTEIEELEAAQQEEQSQAQTSLATALLNSQSNFDRGNNGSN